MLGWDLLPCNRGTLQAWARDGTGKIRWEETAVAVCRVSGRFPPWTPRVGCGAGLASSGPSLPCLPVEGAEGSVPPRHLPGLQKSQTFPGADGSIRGKVTDARPWKHPEDRLRLEAGRMGALQKGPTQRSQKMSKSNVMGDKQEGAEGAMGLWCLRWSLLQDGGQRRRG